MSLENYTGNISDLVATNPTGTDPRSQGDDHLRGIKYTLKQTFPAFNGPVASAPSAIDAAATGLLSGMRNIVINGGMRINQRGVTIAAAAIGEYGPDRWKKVDASNMTQIVEDGNYKPNKTYTLSGTGLTTQQLTSPASGNWTLPNIPITATNIQLEEGSIATPFEQRPIGLELSLCQRYFLRRTIPALRAYNAGAGNQLSVGLPFQVSMRTNPSLTVAQQPTAFANAAAGISLIDSTIHGCSVSITGSTTGQTYFSPDGVGEFSAEL